jgi:hypothetical protein
MILSLLTGINMISGFYQPSNISVPIIISGNDQNDVEDNNDKTLRNYSTCRDIIDTEQKLLFSLAYLEEYPTSLIYLLSSHNRAPPYFS